MQQIYDHAEQNLIMRQCIQKVATGPEYSKDLSYEEAYAAMSEILNGDVDPVQAAVFLIALRMKRETDLENKGVLRAILDKMDFQTADAKQVIDIADPYDGFTRALPVSPFLPALLASLGLPAYCHGLDSVGPKYGVTHSKVLRAAGVATDLSPAQALKQINTLGWTYIDQKNFCPPLYDLIPLRTRIVKRPVLTTVEVLTGPIKGRQSTHLITGYVHKAYPPIYTSLAKFAHFNSAAVIRGCEGGIIPSLQQPARLYEYLEDEEVKARAIDPTELGIEQSVRAVPIPENVETEKRPSDAIASKLNTEALAKHAAKAGTDALKGKAGAGYDSLLYITAIILTHLHHADSMQSAYKTISKQLDSGKAWECFQQALVN